ncbi:hypothetical protein CEXT_790461 [Caerostris extrusa]|uniref:Uncharacterized protein n=1 Tax=Caerostris extrusa TaxID=172846 RepID=A0AAV4WEP4_CAEEX|nr:hypothetical protein CEXT_790461 [Caerostris extrusa]
MKDRATEKKEGKFLLRRNPFHPKLQPTSPEKKPRKYFPYPFPCEPLNRKTLRFAVRCYAITGYRGNQKNLFWLLRE